MKQPAGTKALLKLQRTIDAWAQREFIEQKLAYDCEEPKRARDAATRERAYRHVCEEIGLLMLDLPIKK